MDLLHSRQSAEEVLKIVQMVLYINTLQAKQNEKYFADDRLNEFSSMKMLEFSLKFHWNVFLRIELALSQQRFR